MNTVKKKKEKAVKSQSKAYKRDSATLYLVIVPLLLLHSFDGICLNESYLYRYCCFNILLQFLLVAFLKGFCLTTQEGFGSWFLKMSVNLAQYRVTGGIFINTKCQIICPAMVLAIPH